MAKRSLSLYPGTFAVCRLAPDSDIPAWATQSPFFSVTKTIDEVSIICPQSEVPAGVKSEPGWAALKVDGTLDFSLTGILAGLLTPLAEPNISVFAISTFDTDFILIPSQKLRAAIQTLESAGHKVQA